MSEKVTNKKYVSADIALAFADFKKDHPSIVFSLKDSNIKGYSDSLSAACVVLATTYLNHIVENFKRRDMAKELLYKLAEDYCWEIITNGNPEWPIKQFVLVSICKTAEVSTLCDELREKLPLPPTIGVLASAPSKFVSTFSFIIAEIEKLAASCNDPKKVPRSFPLMPTSSLHWRYGNVNAFYSIFDFQKFGYRSVEEVIAGENKFTCFILSDGFGICFGFSRKARDVQEVSLELEDFRDEEVRRYFQPCAVDPDRKQVFTSIIHHEEGQQEVCSKCNEYGLENLKLSSGQRSHAYLVRCGVVTEDPLFSVARNRSKNTVSSFLEDLDIYQVKHLRKALF
ncbi:hypothetical protein HPULCUR_003345 [Helicostylum pulchrum]|uniref:Uncharacterized protein n=1 Tax=Helicostylum pulchrum TaxID=562976 RepID=A0ABP9XV47_9FUNG